MSFKRFDQEDIVVSAESVTSPLWSGDQVTLQGFYTSSTQVAGTTGDYYINVYQTGSGLQGSRTQFSIAYADKSGFGALVYNSASADTRGKSPTSTIYGQYRSLVLGDEEANFNFGGVDSDHFYVLAIDRARFKEKLLPGTLDLRLKISGSAALQLTDNSSVQTTTTFNDAGRVYELVSGSLGQVAEGKVQDNGYTAGSGSYGKLLPDIGVILLNGKALDAAPASGGLALATNRDGDTVGNNNRRLYDALKEAGSFRLQSQETVTSNFVFVRARNGEFNYSTNPSLITGSGEIRHDVMVDSPQSYITAVGLYNDNNDLLAVAKLSRPLVKDFTKEALVRIKLDY